MLRSLVLGSSGFACGLALYLTWVHVRDWRQHRPFAWAYVCARLGFTIVVLLVAEAVFGVPDLPLTWRVLAYTLGLVIASIGFLGIAVEHRRRRQGRLETRNGGGP